MIEIIQESDVLDSSVDPYDGMEYQVIIPKHQFIDDSEWVDLWEFEKIIESTEMIDWVLVTTRSIVEMDFDDKLKKRIKSLKEKIIDWTITSDERDDLRLLTS